MFAEFTEFFSQSSGLLPMLLVGFGLGALHALDADHIMAVSVLSNQKPGIRRTLWQSMNWALGHGGVLVLSGVFLFGFGLALPETLQHAAEASVGLLLIVLGLGFYLQMRKERLSLQKHSHGDIEHTHWQTENHGTEASATREAHKPVFVGVLHGLAGSAPALALIPAVGKGDITLAIGYLLIFSLGVMLSMLAFGLGFARIQHFLSHNYNRIFAWSRHGLALGSIALGSFWLYQAAL